MLGEILKKLPQRWQDVGWLVAIFGFGVSSGAAAVGFIGLPRKNAEAIALHSERISYLDSLTTVNAESISSLERGLRQSNCLSYVYLQTIRDPQSDANNMADRCFFPDELSGLFVR